MILAFPYLTVVDDQEYYPDHPRIYEAVEKYADDPFVSQTIGYVEAAYGVGFINELRQKQHVRDPVISRHLQMGLYLCLGRIAQRLWDVTGYAGYCGGLTPALVLSGGLTGQGFQQVGHILDVYGTDLIRSFLRMSIYSCLVELSRSWTKSAISDLLDRLAHGEVFLKDVKARSSWEVIGTRTHVETVINHLQQIENPRFRTGPLVKDTLAHTPHVRLEAFRRMWAKVGLDVPEGAIYASSGGVWYPGDSLEHLRDIYFATNFEPINTRIYLARLRRSRQPVMYIGSRKALRAMLEGAGASEAEFRNFEASLPAGSGH